jgi:hypothetical protein
MRKTIVLFALLGLVAAGMVSVIAKEEDQEESATETVQVPDSTRVVVYAEINAGFERLKPVFVRGCFDCHSDQTKYPWYHKLPIIGGWMDGHIKGARHHLDMSNGFPFGGEDSQTEMLENIKHEIEEGDMPLLSYRLMHWSAEPDKAEKDSIYAWVDQSVKLLKSSTAVKE